MVICYFFNIHQTCSIICYHEGKKQKETLDPETGDEHNFREYLVFSKDSSGGRKEKAARKIP
jgi:hypothetical protein